MSEESRFLDVHFYGKTDELLKIKEYQQRKFKMECLEWKKWLGCRYQFTLEDVRKIKLPTDAWTTMKKK